jgi:hypothetical protein
MSEQWKDDRNPNYRKTEGTECDEEYTHQKEARL